MAENTVMSAITWLAERSGLPFGTADQMARAEATVRAWADAGVISIESSADKWRELEIVRAIAQNVDGWTPIEAVQGLGTSLRSALKSYDLQVNGQPSELTADVIEVIEAARDGKSAFVRTIVIERAGEPMTYDARLMFHCNETALDQATDAIMREYRVLPPNRVLQHKTINLTDALNYKPKSAEWSER